MGAEAEPTKTDEGGEAPEEETSEEVLPSDTEEQKSQIDDIVDGWREQNGEVEEEPEAAETEEESEQPGEPEEEPTREEQEEEEPESREQELLEKIETLEEEVQDLRSDTETEESEEEVEEEPEEEETIGYELEDKTFVTEEEYDEVLESHEGLNELFNAFRKEFGQEIGEKIKQDILQDIPRIVRQSVERTSERKSAVDQFRDRNEDLLEQAPDFVQHMANKVQSENPDWSTNEILEETEKRVRNQLGATQKAREREEERQEEESSNNSSDGPATARKPRGRRGPRSGEGEDLSDQQQQINEIIDRP